jgi:beta-glucosidase-like glycosyl hydrolase
LYLRNSLGFSGLVVTDSLGAGALSALGLAPPAASVKALAAGADLVLAGSPGSASASLRLAQETSLAVQGAVANGVVPLLTLQSAAAHDYAALSSPTCPASAAR